MTEAALTEARKLGGARFAHCSTAGKGVSLWRDGARTQAKGIVFTLFLRLTFEKQSLKAFEVPSSRRPHGIQSSAFTDGLCTLRH